jgi:hypothetical protein
MGGVPCYDGIAVAGTGTGVSPSTTGRLKSFYAEVHSPNSARHSSAVCLAQMDFFLSRSSTAPHRLQRT